jgi:ABC-type glutathione transport system ATPase component
MTIELIDVTKHYAAIENLTLTLSNGQATDGQATALVGESGSGKSTLSRMIALLERPDSGEIRLDGRNAATLRGTERRRLRSALQLILQNAPAAFDPRVRIEKSIAEPLRNLTALSHAEIAERVREVCAEVAFPPALLSRLPGELSGGQVKRASFARAFVTRPEFVLFDETTSGLDPRLRERVLDLILRLKSETLRSFLFITHDMDAATRVAERVLVMKNGSIVEDARVTDGRAAFTHEYAKLLQESKL